MPVVSFNLPGPLHDWVRSRAKSGRYGSASEYIRELIRGDQDRQAIQARASGKPPESDELPEKREPRDGLTSLTPPWTGPLQWFEVDIVRSDKSGEGKEALGFLFFQRWVNEKEPFLSLLIDHDETRLFVVSGCSARAQRVLEVFVLRPHPPLNRDLVRWKAGSMTARELL